MPQYLLAVHYPQDESDVPPADVLAEIDRDVVRLHAELEAEGSFVFAGGLHLANMSTVVDATGGDTVVTDGPYAETKEQLGGFLIVEAPDLDAALAIAARSSAATRLPIEVRPFKDGFG